MTEKVLTPSSTDDVDIARVRIRGRYWFLLAPLVAFLVVNSVLWMAAHVDGFNYWATETWTHWDAYHYLSIADDGYEYVPCTTLELYDVGSIVTRLQELVGAENVTLEDVCGNSGWFPGYPALITLVSLAGVTGGQAGVAIAVAFQIATLYALWVLFLRDSPRPVAFLALITATFFFGHVYYRAVFPMSMTTFLLLIHLYLMRERRWLAAGATAAAAAFTYPTAWLLAPVGVAWLWFTTTDLERRQRIKAAIVVAAPPLLAIGAVTLLQWLQTDVVGAFFKHQSGFGYGPSLPTERLGRVFSPLFRNGIEMATVPNLQTALVAVVVVTLVVIAAVRWKALSATERWVALALFAFWLFPLMLGGKSSLYRIDSLLLPGVLLISRLPMAGRVTLTATCVALSYPMALLFFRGVLI